VSHQTHSTCCSLYYQTNPATTSPLQPPLSTTSTATYADTTHLSSILSIIKSLFKDIYQLTLISLLVYSSVLPTVGPLLTYLTTTVV